MGLFKDLKNIRETTAEHGGMPNIKDARRDVSSLFDDRGEREILKTGIAAKAIVRGFTMPVQGDRFAMQVPLEVFPPEGEPYHLNYVFPVVRMQAAISAGLEVPVKISREDPNHIAVQWDAQKAAIAGAGGSLAATMEGLSHMSTADANAMMTEAMHSQGAVIPPMMQPPAPAAAPAADPEARLAQLAHLKEKGLIDEAQYQAKRQQIIDEI